MTNQQKIIFLTVLSLVVIFLLVRPYLFDQATASTGRPVKELLDEAFAQDKVVAIIFSYDAECCPSSQQFFGKYGNEVSRVLAEYSDEIKSVWINVGAESSADQAEIIALSQRHNVTQIPSLLILDNNGEILGLLEGEFDAGQAKNLLQEVLE